MKNVKALGFGLVFAFAAMAGTAVQASSQPHMEVAGRTSQPIGHARFCEQLPHECSIRSKSTKAPKLTREAWSQIIEVNNRVNLSVQPVTDEEYYKTTEHWTYPDGYGDCEDYVLLKRYLLMKAGWPASSLLITVVRQQNGDGHAVLTVRTDRADYVLDNLEMQVKQWDETPYRFLKRQSSKHSGRWTSIRDGRGRIASR